jgi:hypothetical protein
VEAEVVVVQIMQRLAVLAHLDKETLVVVVAHFRVLMLMAVVAVLVL